MLASIIYFEWYKISIIVRTLRSNGDDDDDDGIGSNISNKREHYLKALNLKCTKMKKKIVICRHDRLRARDENTTTYDKNERRQLKRAHTHTHATPHNLFGSNSDRIFGMCSIFLFAPSLICLLFSRARTIIASLPSAICIYSVLVLYMYIVHMSICNHLYMCMRLCTANKREKKLKSFD